MKAKRIDSPTDHQTKANPRDRIAVLEALASVPESIAALGPEMVRYWRSKSVKLHDSDQSETPDDIRRWAQGEIARADDRHNGWRRNGVANRAKNAKPNPASRSDDEHHAPAKPGDTESYR